MQVAVSKATKPLMGRGVDEGYCVERTLDEMKDRIDRVNYDNLFKRVESAGNNLKSQLESLRINNGLSLREACPSMQDVLRKHIESLKMLREKPLLSNPLFRDSSRKIPYHF